MHEWLILRRRLMGQVIYARTYRVGEKGYVMIAKADSILVHIKG